MAAKRGNGRRSGLSLGSLKDLAIGAACLVGLLFLPAGRAQVPSTRPAALAKSLPPEQQKRLAEGGVLADRVVQLFNQHKYQEALPLAQRSLDIVREVFGEQDPPYPVYVQCLENLACQYDALGDTRNAEPLHRMALKIARQTLGDIDPLTAAILSKLSDLYVRTGKYALAEPLLQQAVEAYGRAMHDKDPRCRPRDYGSSLNNLALLYERAGDYAKAEPLLRQFVEVYRQAAGEKSPEYADVLSRAGVFYDDAGDYAKAEPLLRRGAAIAKEALGEKHPFYAKSLNNIGFHYLHTGDYGKAEPVLRQAVEIWRELGAKDTDYATALSNLANAYQLTSDHARAEPLFRQALEVYQEAPGNKDPLLYSNYLNNLAALYMDTGDYARAEPLFRKALEVRRQWLGESHPLVAASLNNLGALYQRTGDARAESLYRQSLAMLRTTVGEKHPDYASGLGNLAEIYVASGDYARGEPMLRQAMEIQRDALGEEHPQYAASLDRLAVLYAQTNEYAKAEPLFVKAQSIMRRQFDLTASVESERQQLDNEWTSRQYLDHFLDGSRRGAAAGQVYAAAVAWKGIVSLRQGEMRSLRQIEAGTNVAAPEHERASSLCHELEASARRLAALTRGGIAGDVKTPVQRGADIALLSDRVERLQAELSGLSESYRNSRQRRYRTPDEIAQSLPPGTVLIDVFEYTGATSARAENAPSQGRCLVGFVVRRGHEVQRVELAPSEPINDAVEAWRQGSFGQTESARQAGMRLRKLVWEPLAAKIDGATTVIISPDGPLSRLPLGALPGSAPGKYLIEEVSIATVPVPQVLPGLLTGKTTRDDGSPSLLLVGDVDFEAAAPLLAHAAPAALPAVQPAEAIASSAFVSRSAVQGAAPSWPALPGTRAEIADVRQSFQHRWPSGHLTALQGSAATEQAVREAAAQSRYLHLATHGFFAPGQVKSALGPSTRLAALEMAGDPFGRVGVVGFHPGLLSGIVLAGANVPPRDGQDDGILTALEVEELDLTHVDMAVLSACETGLGQTAGGEGLLGLQRAFQVAGARTVVASLWKVPDTETRQLMDRFYDNLWVKKMPKLQALREAQLWMLSQGAAMEREEDRGLGAPTTAPSARYKGRLPPYFWAGFVLSGDWR